MTSPPFDGPSELALAVYLEELAAGKRALYLAREGEDGGPSEAGRQAARRLADVARSVDLVVRGGRPRSSRRGARVRARGWPTAEDEGRWSLIVAPDLEGLGLADPAAALSRWLSDDGVLVAATPVEGGLGYDALFDLFEPAFREVRMVGEAPFAGRALVEFGAESGAVTVDGSLVEDRAADRFVVICSRRPQELDGYAVVQMPLEVAAVPEEDASQEALDAAVLHGEELERALDAATRELKDTERRLRKTTDRLTRQEEARAALEAERDGLERKLAAAPAAEARAGAAGQGGLDGDYVRLEQALQAAGREAATLQEEVDRRGLLVRDLVEELKERVALRPRPATAVEEPTSDRTPSEKPSEAESEAVERAVRAEAARAEAARAELRFRLDEVQGELALLRQQTVERTATEEVEELRRLEAALRGTVRGLNARLAEVIELYQQTQARLALTEDDRRHAAAEAQRFERLHHETRERLDAEIARTSSLEREAETDPAPPREERAIAEREGKLIGALMATRDSLASEREKRVALERRLADEGGDEALKRSYEQRIADLVEETGRLGGEAERALVQVGELRSQLERERALKERAQGENEGLRLRLADRDAAVDELTGGGRASGRGDEEASTEGGGGEESANLAAQLEGVRRGATVQAAELRNDLLALSAERDALRERAASAEARVPRLVRELAAARAEAAEERAGRSDVRALEARLESQRDELDQLKSERASVPPPPPPGGTGAPDPVVLEALVARVQRSAAAERSKRRAAEAQLLEARDALGRAASAPGLRAEVAAALRETRGILASFAEDLRRGDG